MEKDRNKNLLNADIAVVCMLAASFALVWKLGKKAGYSKGITDGMLQTYVRILG